MLTRLIRVLFSCELPYTAQLGKGTLLNHNGLGCVIHHKAVIGEDCCILQNVSIAGRNGRGVPVLGNNVFVGAGACILGGVKIGNNVKIGANAVVLHDIPDGETWAGVPARKLH